MTTCSHENTSARDILEYWNTALIQHGKSGNRIYLMKSGNEDPGALADHLEAFAAEKGYDKIFAKVSSDLKPTFADKGYTVEAEVPGFFNGKLTGFFMARFLSPARAAAKDPEDLARILKLARETPAVEQIPPLPEGLHFHKAGISDAENLAIIYREVFASYPFPIHDPAYIRKTMEQNITYYIIHANGVPSAASSAERDDDAQNVEMTDFATIPTFRGKGLALFLLDHMEQDMKQHGMKTSFTIARSRSAGMNITFARMGYCYDGTLINNTQICGEIESMNVWHKPL